MNLVVDQAEGLRLRLEAAKETGQSPGAWLIQQRVRHERAGAGGEVELEGHAFFL